MVAGGVRHDAAAFHFFDAQPLDQADDGVVRAAGFEGADFLQGLGFEVKVEFGGGRSFGGGSGGQAVEGSAG